MSQLTQLTPPGDLLDEGLAAAAKLRRGLGLDAPRSGDGSAAAHATAAAASANALLAGLEARLREQQEAARAAERRLDEECLEHRRASEALRDQIEGLRAEVCVRVGC